MKYAPIVPKGYLHVLKNCPVVMALAHLCDDEEYAAFYKRLSDEGTFVILDNSIVELGKAVSIDFLLEAAAKIGAHEIIMPDSFKDAEGTVILAHQYYDELRKRFKGRIQGVAHGRSASEWAACARVLIKMGVDTIGVPKVMTSMLGSDGRMSCIETLCMNPKQRIPDIHFLGISENPLEVGMYEKARVKNKNLPVVRSVDSVIAYHYASECMHFEDGERPTTEIDFLDDSYNPKISSYLLENIISTLQLCKDNQEVLMPEDYFPRKEIETISSKVIQFPGGR